MRSLPSSSSSYSLASTSLSNRLETVFRKAEQLSILCQIDVCVIYYGPKGDLKTFPNDKDKVRNMAMRYIQLNEALRNKKRVNLSEFLKDKGGLENPNKRRKTCPKDKGLDVLIQDKGLDVLIQSLELNISTFQERVRFLESSSSSSSSQNHQTQSLNPNPRQFSLFMYNHRDNTLSQIPLSDYDRMSDITNNSFQHPCYSGVQDSVNNFGMNQLMHKEFYGYDHNMCSMDSINRNSFQHPCEENYSAVQESVDNSGLMQHEVYGYDQNLCTSNFTYRNVPQPSFSNPV
ncbi:PREDICTED: agamous-like MADS-box protein AGL75 [Camelina sativa]|uniref:Agamous-like MADS-box protein AGL75 n=1 Tax=Camelina sativa TaxID=90675 RepID=A0ABM0V6U1_CAMSA|nr:PREDICTED: agamous-like MADS-box protein AGL75 [Camelina sativa]